MCVIGATIYRAGWRTRERANAGPLSDPCGCVSYWQTHGSLRWPAFSSQEKFLKCTL